MPPAYLKAPDIGNLPLAFAQSASCTGKHPFQSAKVAHVVAKRAPFSTADVYRCSFCGFYHVGAMDAAKHRVSKRELKQNEKRAFRVRGT